VDTLDDEFTTLIANLVNKEFWIPENASQSCINDLWYWYTWDVSVILILILYQKCIMIYLILDTFLVSRYVSWYMYHWYFPTLTIGLTPSLWATPSQFRLALQVWNDAPKGEERILRYVKPFGHNAIRRFMATAQTAYRLLKSCAKYWAQLQYSEHSFSIQRAYTVDVSCAASSTVASTTEHLRRRTINRIHSLR